METATSATGEPVSARTSRTGKKFQESCYDDLPEAVEDLYSRIEQQLGDGDFAFFGHSMGAMLCYELIGKIWEKRNLAPIHAFLSGRVPPNSKDIKMLHHLSDTRLMAEIKRWGGFSSQQLADKTLIRMFLPILRADMKMIETYSMVDREYPRLPCPFSILTGTNDAVAPSHKMLPWADFTTQSCSFHTFAGGHFYITERQDELIDYINTVLSEA